MKFCSQCGNQLDDAATVCNNCGANMQANYQPPIYVDPYNHTNEFDASDISENKAVAMLPYLLGTIGLLIAALLSKSSKYVTFHLKQALKILVVEAILIILAAILFITIIVPIAAGICFIILFVLKIIQFFSICSGKAKEVPIIRSLGFLK